MSPLLVLTRRLEAAANEEEVEKEEEVKDEEEEMAGFSKSPYPKISIPRKTGKRNVLEQDGLYCVKFLKFW